MTIRPILFLLGLAAALSLPAAARAGGIFSKHAKPNPAERVPQLLGILKSEPDERKREAAAKELRDFDAAAFPEIVPALVEALLSDARTGVRVEAADSLGKVRPVNQLAGQALEQAQANDASLRVRLQARRTLLGYRLSGYHSPGKPEEKTAANPGPRLEAPPQARPRFTLAAPQAKPGHAPAETAPPPLAQPEYDVPQLLPMPQGSGPPGGSAPQLPPPVRTGTEQGPALLPR